MFQRPSKFPFPLIRLSSSFAGLFVIFANFSAGGLSKEPEQASVEQRDYFEKHIRPVLIEHCFECHSAKKTQGGFRLDDAAAMQRGGDSGAAIQPGSPNESLLITAIRYKNQDLQMPPKGPLPKEVVDTLEKWIADGAYDPRVAPSSDEGSPKPVGMSIEEGKKFWSFVPVGEPNIPKVVRSEWVQNPIDAFILHKLEEQGLHPAGPVDRRHLLRRVTFDLTGLPPTFDEVQAFLEDTSPDAYRKVVDRLLDSPQYGVRWGRHWLDVARYADSNGLDENLALGNAWRYRDYVIDAFNRDLPFDRFVIEQLAGDLLPDADLRTRTATGYLVLGAKVLAEPDREKLEMDTIDEQLDSIGKGFMGMTFGCVRCHDHKFDPLSQKDYYALAAIMKSTKTFAATNTGAIKHWNEFPFHSEDQVEALKRIDAEIAEKNKLASTFKSNAMTKIREEARRKGALYLIAATKFDPDAPLSEVEKFAEPDQLHPRILHHCRLHLEYHTDDPFFGKWHEFVSQGDIVGLESHYRSLIEKAAQAWEETLKKDPKAKKLEDESLEIVRAALHDHAGFLAVPPKPEFAFDEATLAEYDRLAEEARIVESNAPDWPAVMAVSDGTVSPRLPIHVRGSHRNLGEPVGRAFPEVFSWGGSTVFPRHASGRLELAQWLVHSSHPLTSRVYVNRIWGWHFGESLVRSTENFGKLGDRPSHPELLDWLARTLIESGWSTKELHRLILTSNTYQMDSRHGEESQISKAAIVDPENRLLWKFRPRRLEAEEVRDSILAVAGLLDISLNGKTVPLRNRQFVFNHTSKDHTKYDSLRRAAFLPIIRNNLYTFFEQFDFPDPTTPTGHRNSTTIAPQALLVMNSDLVLDAAERLANAVVSRSSNDQNRVELAYEIGLSRRPTELEIKQARDFVDQLLVEARTDAANVDPKLHQQAWSLFCQNLLAGNEFFFVR